ncbi:ArsR/SmtB family transcription factor [Actinoallomurus acaciae]|uniref:ArsR/SmtB family transcription factor n=1 Tax=Actinoallomurus acaciae TaxID=502577 RepID=A0ABV5Y9G2_9ACTN
MQSRSPGTLYREWWTTTHRRLRAYQDDVGPARRLSGLVPLRGDFPDFLTPPEGLDGLEAALDSLAAVPRDRLRADMSRLRPQPSRPTWVRLLGRGDRTVHAKVVDDVRRYFTAFIQPAWPTIDSLVTAECGRRTQQYRSGGVERLLEGLPPGFRWSAPVLAMDYPVERTVDLRGRGITLIPSFFCTVTPVTLIDADLPPVLVYPVRPLMASRPAPSSGASEEAHAALAAIIGGTRATILRTLTTPCTTTELAEYIDMSLASASHHAGLLRKAGLITTVRNGQTVTHALTPRGHCLLPPDGESAASAFPP